MMLRVRNEGCPWLELHLQKNENKKQGRSFRKSSARVASRHLICLTPGNVYMQQTWMLLQLLFTLWPFAGCCYNYCSLYGRLQDAVTIVHSVAICRMLLQLLFTQWPFAGCCYNCSLCGHLQDAFTITVTMFTLWPFAGYCYDRLLCGCLQDFSVPQP